MSYGIWDDAYKITLSANLKGFLSHYLSGPLSYVRRHITINKMC